MAKQTVKSGLAAKLGKRLDEAVRKHADDPTDYGIVRLPGGITNGIAKLIECKFDQYKPGSNMKKADGSSAVGEYYFRAAGVVVSPEDVTDKDGNAVRVAGLQTSIMIPMCDTKTQAGDVTTVDDYIERVLNELRKLGVDTTGATGDDLEPLAAAAKDAAPYFRFSTSKSKPTPQFPDPRVWENWNGTKGLENYVPDEAPAVDDQTGAAAAEPSANGTAGEYRDDQDVDSLAAVADDDNHPDQADAQDKLTKFALDAGHTQKAIDGTKKWSEVADLIKAGAGEAAADPADEGGGAWEAGNVCTYKVKDPKNPKKAGKPTKCQVTAVAADEKTVTLKNLEDRKTVYKAVSVNEIEAVS